VAQKRKKASRAKVSSTRTKKRSLSSADMKHFRQILLEKRKEILNNVNGIEGEALKKSRMDALGLMDSERKLLREIDEALERIENQTYGICESTGKLIRKARLEAQPWAKYCVEYARMLEQGLVQEQ